MSVATKTAKARARKLTAEAKRKLAKARKLTHRSGELAKQAAAAEAAAWREALAAQELTQKALSACADAGLRPEGDGVAREADLADEEAADLMAESDRPMRDALDAAARGRAARVDDWCAELDRLARLEEGDEDGAGC